MTNLLLDAQHHCGGPTTCDETLAAGRDHNAPLNSALHALDDLSASADICKGIAELERAFGDPASAVLQLDGGAGSAAERRSLTADSPNGNHRRIGDSEFESDAVYGGRSSSEIDCEELDV